MFTAHALIVFACAFTDATAQIPIPTPDFSCKPRAILGWLNGAIPSCSDTITLTTDPPFMRDSSRLYSRGASLHRLRWIDDSLVLGEEISCRVVAEPPALNVHLILEYHLPTHELDGSPVYYQVNLYCGYWFGVNDTDTTTIRFSMYPRYRAIAEARRVGDSALLKSEFLVSPVSMPTSGYAITSSMTITAREEHDGAVFNHWTASHAGIAFDKYGREQRISVACWPMSDTVRFTAWYRADNVSSVSESELDDVATVELYDLQGRSVYMQHDARWPTGTYIAVITRADGVRVFRQLSITN